MKNLFFWVFFGALAGGEFVWGSDDLTQCQKALLEGYRNPGFLSGETAVCFKNGLDCRQE